MEQQPTTNALVRLNVGGAYFTTLRETLMGGGRSYFSAMLDGRFGEPKLNAEGCIFVDRNPELFGMILDYLRFGVIHLRELSELQHKRLEDEVLFYGIDSLLKKIRSPSFLTRYPLEASPCGKRVCGPEPATKKCLYAISDKPFSETKSVMEVLVVEPGCASVGVAPRSILEPGVCWSRVGWHFTFFDGSKSHACKIDGDGDAVTEHFLDDVAPGSVVGVQLTTAGDVLIRVDDDPWRVMYSKIACNEPMHLVVVLAHTTQNGFLEQGGAIELLQ